jgi:hypothetical protein
MEKASWSAHQEGYPRSARAAERPCQPAAFRYFLYRQMVTFLIDSRGLSFQQVVDRSNQASDVVRSRIAD